MKKQRYYVIKGKDGGYTDSTNNEHYTGDIDNAELFFTREDARQEKTEPGEKIVEVIVKIKEKKTDELQKTMQKL